MGQGKLSWIVALWFAYTAFALPSRDGDEQEYFPLSGGIANGVMVTINAEIDTSKRTRIEFLTPAREVAFGWYMDVTAKTVKHGHRNSSWEALYPVAALSSELTQGSPLKLEFMKRKFQWGVAVNGQIQSWYSFSIPLEDVATLVTHVSVHSGFANPEVVQQRQECNVQCHEDECMGKNPISGGWESKCPVGMRCTTTRRSANRWEAEACSNSSKADDVDENCCDGKPMTIPHSNEWETKWVRLIASAEMTKFCAEYDQCDEKLVAVAGRNNTKGLILSIDGDSSYNVAVPGRQEHRQSGPGDQIQLFPAFDGTHMKIPKFALRQSTKRNLKLKENVMGDYDFNSYKLDKSGILVSSTIPDHLDMQGWFLEYVTVAFDGENGTRWLRGASGAQKLIDQKGSLTADFWYSDQGDLEGECADEPYTGENPAGLEAFNATCGNWKDGQWCYPWGQKTPALCNDTSLPDPMCTNPFRPDGPSQCCACGGGSWTPTVSFASHASHLLFQ